MAGMIEREIEENVNKSCLEGYTGAICAECDYKSNPEKIYYRESTTCEECKFDFSYFFFLIFNLLFQNIGFTMLNVYMKDLDTMKLLMVILETGKRDKIMVTPTIYMKILITYITILLAIFFLLSKENTMSEQDNDKWSFPHLPISIFNQFQSLRLKLDCIFGYFTITRNMSSELLVLILSVALVLMNCSVVFWYYWAQRDKLVGFKNHLISGFLVIWNYYNVGLCTICTPL